MPNLSEEDLRTPLPQAFADNLVQICPKHASHDIIPAGKEETLEVEHNKKI